MSVTAATTTSVFKRGQLWEMIQKVSERATQISAIEKIESSPLYIEEGGVNFMVSVATALAKRPFNFDKTTSNGNNNGNVNNNNGASEQQQIVKVVKKKEFIDPFLPCDKDLFVCELFDTHNLVLNKFNVSNHHSIIATKDFEEQTDPLNKKDFIAIWECIKSCNMLCFFNCGPNSGASQPHKHFQLLRLPYFDNDVNLNCPIESLFRKYLTGTNQIIDIPTLQFRNAFISLDQNKIESLNRTELSEYLESNYISLLKYLNLINNCNNNNSNSSINNNNDTNNNNNIENQQQCPKSYNFIMTPEWMFMVPRRTYHSRGISINSVGFTGSILVKKEEELETIKQYGIMNILKDVSFEKSSKI